MKKRSEIDTIRVSLLHLYQNFSNNKLLPKRKNLLFAILIIELLFAINLQSQDCGIKRWNVKTLSDADTTLIDFSIIIKSTVHFQTSLPEPKKKSSVRMLTEGSIYSIDCFIVAYKKNEDDKDIHVVIMDPSSKETMVAEIISPECSSVKITSRYGLFKEVETWFVENIGTPSSSFYEPKRPKLVTITGVGFFDNDNGQRGMAENGREIHPVLSIKFKEFLKPRK